MADSWGAKGIAVGAGLLCGLSLATELFAYHARLSPVLGPPLWRQSLLAFYPPWAVLGWAWQWAGRVPAAFQWPLVAGVVLAGVTIAKTWPRARSTTQPQAHWASWVELKKAELLGHTGVVLGTSGRALLQYGGVGHILVVAGTQCHAPGAKILMGDGALKCVETITVGDKVMGPDSLPRTVQALFHGDGEMVRILPKKGEPFTVSLDHILVLKRTNKIRYAHNPVYPRASKEGEIVEISVRDWLASSKKFKHLYKLFRVGVEFPMQEPLPIDPYLLGVILGDGTIRRYGVVITNNNKGRLKRKIASILDKTDLHISGAYNDQRNGTHTFAITSRTVARHPGNGKNRILRWGREHNSLTKALKALGLAGARSGTKFIPGIYKVASKEARLWILAGLMDTDGSLSGSNLKCLAKNYDYITKSQALADDVCFIARSLGLAAYKKECEKGYKTASSAFRATYYRVSIFGNTSTIPCQIESKQVRLRRRQWGHPHLYEKTQKLEYKHSPLVTGFTVEAAGVGPCCGVTCDGDQRYLMGDFTVTHNSGKTVSIVLPTLLAEEPGQARSMIVHDPKENLYPKSAGYRSTLGKVVRLAPLHPETDFLNPWDAVRLGTEDEFRDVELIATYLTNPEGKASRDDVTEHFQELVNQFFCGVFLYGLHTGIATTGGAFNDLVNGTAWRDLLTVMEAHGHPEVQRAAVIASRPGDRELGALQTTAARALRIFSDPRIAHMTSTSSFSLAELREAEQPCTVYLSVPFGDQQRLRPLTRLLLRQLLDHCTSRLHGWKHRMLAMIEEFPSLGRFDPISDGLNFAAEFGLQYCLITPSMEELIDTYGNHHNLLEGCRVQAVFGLSDDATAKRFSGRVGTRERRTQRITTQQGGRQSRTEDVKEEPLLNATGFLDLGEREVAVFAGRYKVICEQSRYYEHKDWARRALLPPPRP